MRGTVPTGPRPDPLPLNERLVSNVVRFPVFVLATAFFGSLALAASLFEKNGTRVTVLGRERLKGEPAVYVCNHLSYMDTPVIFSSLPFQFRIVARHDL